MAPDFFVALCDLDQRTLVFLVDEMWHRGSDRVLAVAKASLAGGLHLGTTPAALRTLLGVTEHENGESPAFGYRLEE